MKATLLRSLMATVALLLTLGLSSGTAFAEGTDPSVTTVESQTTTTEDAPAGAEGIKGTLRNGSDTLGGVVLNVTGPDGFSQSVTSKDDGTWELSVPGPGDYKVELDVTTLPKGLALTNPERNPFSATVALGQTKPILFGVGDPNAESTAPAAVSLGDRALDRFANGIRFGLLLALAAIGISLIFGTTGLTNFAHGELITMGALFALMFTTQLGVPFFPAVLLAVALSAFVGWLLDLGLWAPLRRRGTGVIAGMIVSIGLSIAVRFLYQFIIGGTTYSYEATRGQKSIGPGPIVMTALDYVSMGISLVALLAVAYFLLGTRLGKATRAVADNPALAAASGIDVERTIQIVWAMGASLAGLAGILLAINQGITFQMGYQILLLAFAAVTLGGLGTAMGALVGALVVGLFIEMSTLVIPTELKNIGALAILIVMLLVRPQGLLGRPERIG